MKQLILPESIWIHKPDHIVIDVRSPSEYLSGHIPDAINLPLFTDEERKIVGTTYKQVSPESAFLKGLDIVGPKMSKYLKTVKKLNNKNLIIYCARGGKRSDSMSWLFDFAGYKVKVIKGGYKAYRQFILESFSNINARLLVLGGKTGIGKSALLNELKLKGEQILDLERIACHKGSAFGRLGENQQPSHEHFENLLYDSLMKLDLNKTIWIENESKSIGSVYIPLGFWAKMKSSPLINITVDEEYRLNNLIVDYGSFPKEQLQACFKTIEKKIGGVECKTAIEAIENGDLKTAAKIALKYYDKTYEYNLENTKSPIVYKLNLTGDTSYQNAEILLNYVRKSLSTN